jgi:hypothetical protein
MGNVFLLFGTIMDSCKMRNLGYQQVIHNTEVFAIALLWGIFVAILCEKKTSEVYKFLLINYI